MTAPYRDPGPVRSGQTLRDLEHRRRIVTGEEWLPFDVLPVPPDEEPTLVVNWVSLRSLSVADQARAAASHLTVVRWPSTDGPVPYESRVSRRYAQKMAWIRRLQDALGQFWQALFAVCLLIAAYLFVAWVAS